MPIAFGFVLISTNLLVLAKILVFLTLYLITYQSTSAKPKAAAKPAAGPPALVGATEHTGEAVMA